MDLQTYTDEWVHDRRTIRTSVTTVNGAATPVTIKSAKHSATNNGFRKRVDDCVYSVMTSDALPKMPPNTTMQYKIINRSSQLFQMTVPSSNSLVADVALAPLVVVVVVAVNVNCDATAAVSRSAIACDDAAAAAAAAAVLLCWCCCWWWCWWRMGPLLLALPLRLLLKTETYWLSCCKCHVESWPIIYGNQVI